MNNEKQTNNNIKTKIAASLVGAAAVTGIGMNLLSNDRKTVDPAETSSTSLSDKQIMEKGSYKVNKDGVVEQLPNDPNIKVPVNENDATVIIPPISVEQPDVSIASNDNGAGIVERTDPNS